MRVEEAFQAECMVIESNIVNYYRNNPDLLDSQVERVLIALIRVIKAEIKGISPSIVELDGHDEMLFNKIKPICDELVENNEDLDKNTCILIIKRLQKSVKRWSKELGRQGYLTFISGFL